MHYPYTVELDVEPHLCGVRIDTFLARRFRSYTTWRLMRLVREGQVRVDGELIDTRHRVYPGQKILVRLLEPPDDLIPSENIPFDIVFEDEWLVVANKPAGLIIHPTGETPSGSLVNAVQHYLDQTSAWPGLLKPGIVHRLDMDTSGVVAIAKDHVSHRELSIQFQRGRVAKAYLALVDGVLKDQQGVINLPIGRAGGTALMSCQADALEARPSTTAYDVIEQLPGHALVKVKPRTGRMHQIRVHFAAIGHPLVGDEFYAPFGVLKPPRTIPRAGAVRPLPERTNCTTPSGDLRPPLGSPAALPASPYIARQALHASELSFTHPFTQEWMTVTAPLPEDMAAALAMLRATP